MRIHLALLCILPAACTTTETPIDVAAYEAEECIVQMHRVIDFENANNERVFANALKLRLLCPSQDEADEMNVRSLSDFNGTITINGQAANETLGDSTWQRGPECDAVCEEECLTECEAFENEFENEKCTRECKGVRDWPYHVSLNDGTLRADFIFDDGPGFGEAAFCAPLTRIEQRSDQTLRIVYREHSLCKKLATIEERGEAEACEEALEELELKQAEQGQ